MEQPVRIALIAFIDDPLDPPGYERFGGGQSFCYDFVRYLVRRGDEVDVVTRLNDPAKLRFEPIGFHLRIHRVAVGAPEDVEPAELAPLLDAIHSHYWLSGDVGRRLAGAHGIRHVHHPLSFLREKRKNGERETSASASRELAELAIFSSVDRLVLLTPTECAAFRSLYPEGADTPVAVIPHGADNARFFPRPESPGAYIRRAARRLEQGS